MASARALTHRPARSIHRRMPALIGSFSCRTRTAPRLRRGRRAIRRGGAVAVLGWECLAMWWTPCGLSSQGRGRRLDGGCLTSSPISRTVVAHRAFPGRCDRRHHSRTLPHRRRTAFGGPWCARIVGRSRTAAALATAAAAGRAGRHDPGHRLRQRRATRCANAAIAVEGTDAPHHLGLERRLRDPRRAGRHPHGAGPADRLPLAATRRVTVAERRRDRAGLHPAPQRGAARPDRRGGRLPGPAHRRGGAGGAGGHLPRRGAPAAGQHRDQRDPPDGARPRSTFRARASPTPATSSGRSPCAA